MSTLNILCALIWKEYTLRRRSTSARLLDIIMPIIKIALIYMAVGSLNKGPPEREEEIKPRENQTNIIYVHTTDNELLQFLKTEQYVSNEECNKSGIWNNRSYYIAFNISDFESEESMLNELNQQAYEDYIQSWWSKKPQTANTATLGVNIAFSDTNGKAKDTLGIKDNVNLTYYVHPTTENVQEHKDILLVLHLYLKHLAHKKGSNVDLELKTSRTVEIGHLLGRVAKMVPVLLFQLVTCVLLFPLCYLIYAILTEKLTDMRQLLHMSGVSTLHYFFSYILVDVSLVLLLALVTAPALAYKNNAYVCVPVALSCCIALVFFTVAFTVFFTNTILALLIFIMGNMGVIIGTSISLTSPPGIFGTPLWLALGTFFVFPPLGAFLVYEAAASLQNEEDWLRENLVKLTAIILTPLISCGFWTFVILYVGEVWPFQRGSPKALSFPFTVGGTTESPVTPVQYKDETRFEQDPTNMDVGIRIENVRKRFGLGPEILKGVNFDVYHGQITVLLGHNGAGKTTLISIITGIYGATSGRICIGGVYADTEPVKARSQIGLCPQENILYDNLSVQEHLTFYAKLKSYPQSQLPAEIARVLSLIQLPQAASVKSKNLSGGMKRRLQLGMAFVGGSKILILDEPSSGLDIEARRGIWDMLLAVKRDYLIFMTTHHMEEADCLGDRIAIMHAGDIKCCGSSMFLKRVFGTGYSLRVLKLEKANNSSIQAFVVSHFHTAKLVKETKVEQLYNFAKQESNKLPQFFRDLEVQKDSLGIVSSGVEPTTLDDVFVKFEKTILDQAESVSVANEIVKPVLHPSCCKRFVAILLKRISMSARSHATYYNVVFILALAWVLAIGLHFLRTYETVKTYDGNLNVLDDFVMLNDTDVAPWFSHLFPNHKNTTRVEGSNNISVSLAESDDKIYCVWAAFDSDDYNAGARTVIRLMNGYITEGKAGDVQINTLIYPEILPIRLTPGQFRGTLVKSVGIFFVIPLVINPVRAILVEKTNKARFLQIMTGVHFVNYWFTNLCFDSALWFTTILAAVTSSWTLLLGLQSQAIYFTALNIGFVIFCMALLVLSCTLLAYLTSFAFDRPAIAFIVLTILSLFLPLLIELLKNLKLPGAKLFPYFGLTVSSYQLNKMSALFLSYSDTQFFCDLLKAKLDLCKNFTMTEGKDFDQFLDLCCESHFKSFYSMLKYGDDSLSPIVIIGFSVVSSILCIVLIIGLEFLFLLMRHSGASPAIKPSEDGVDDDVQKEREKVELVLGERQQSQYALVVQGLSKNFVNKQAVKRLTFIVGKSECFGFLGVNGAGKTTAFKMLVGEIPPSAGQAFILGQSIITNLDIARVQIGYCPQFNAFTPGITGREILNLYGRLRGVKNSELKETVDRIISLVDLETYANRKADNYSGGNKRKLSIGIALIGFPPILFLDEPTVAIDPVARRKIWNIIEYARETVGCAIVLTSHAMDECESLCENIGIMVEGEFKCLGSLQHLKNKFGQGITITMKIRPEKNNIDAVKNGTLSLLPQAVLVDSHTNLVSYQIRDKNVNLGMVYEAMENIRVEHDLEDYQVAETSLEQIFLGMARGSSAPVGQVQNLQAPPTNVVFYPYQ